MLGGIMLNHIPMSYCVIGNGQNINLFDDEWLGAKASWLFSNPLHHDYVFSLKK